MKTNKKKRRANGEGSLYQLPDSRWAAKIRIGYTEKGTAKFKAFYGKTKTEAATKMREFLNEHVLSESDKVYMTLETYMLHWIAMQKERNVSETTYDRIEGIMRNQIIPFLGHLETQSINTERVQAFINDLQDKNYSHATILKTKQLLNGCLRYAVANGDIPFNPVDGVVVPPAKKLKKKKEK